MLPSRTAFLICIAIGVALEVGTLPARGGLAVAVLLSVVIGYVSRGYGWTAPFVVGPAQFVAALYRGGSMAASWAGPLAYFVGLGIGLLAAGFLGLRLRRRTARV
ncbi:MAG: hypothetical protein JSU08_11005 [Acidobacteria bacterium]|nr:hypothetical protein [Acidobacteriota bacterium]